MASDKCARSFLMTCTALLFFGTTPNPAMAEGSSLLGDIIRPARCSEYTEYSVILHGGTARFPNKYEAGIDVIERILKEAGPALQQGATSVDIVHAAVAAMEDTGLFNAGKGARANKAGVVEMDASIMDGRRMNAGAVASVKRVKNPVSAARLVMERSPQVLRVGPDAEEYVAFRGGKIVDPSYFRLSGLSFDDIPISPEVAVTAPAATVPDNAAKYSGVWGGVLVGAIPVLLIVEEVEGNKARVTFGHGIDPGAEILEGRSVRYDAKFDVGALVFDVENPRPGQARFRHNADGKMDMVLNLSNGFRLATSLRKFDEIPNQDKHGTVGAVALDRCGNLAAATSTGGFGSKVPGRVGDSPIIGAGTYANNKTAAVSATGHGEYFMIHVIAHDISARMEYGGETLRQATYSSIHSKLTPAGGRGGVIAVDAKGNIAMSYNTQGMVRGYVTNKAGPMAGVYKLGQ